MFPFQRGVGVGGGHARINKLRETARSFVGRRRILPHVCSPRAFRRIPAVSRAGARTHARRASPTREPADLEAHSGLSGENKSCDAMVPLWKWHVLKFNLPLSPL